MRAISIPYFKYYAVSRRALFVLLACAAVALFAANTAFIGLSVRASAASARASARADVLSISIAELESRVSARDTVTPVKAAASGFQTPIFLSYATKRSLGIILRFGNEL
ncbi:MAG: hypothetical protein Q8R17_02680 [bacterium]|nr:hypothetical protein [bacterium]